MAMTISKDLLGKIVDEVFDGCCEDTSAIEEIYRIVSAHLAQPAQAVDVVALMEHLPDNRAATCAELIRALALTRALSGEKAGPVGDGWQPIETAPKDGSYVDLFADWPADGSAPQETTVIGRVPQCRWNKSRSRFEHSSWWGQVTPVLGATHWMTMPQPPASPTPGKERES